MKSRTVRMVVVAGAASGCGLSGPVAAQTTTPVNPLFTNLTIPATAATQGMWSALKGWPLVGLHSTLMPTGQVITYGTPLNTGVQDGRTFDIWDPAKGLDDPAAHYTLPNAQTIDNGPANGAPTTSSAAATTFNLNGATVAVADTARMSYARQWGNSVVLPTGKVVVTGGSTYADNADANAVYPAEIWDPASGKWTVGASAAVYRGYHSATILLPNGTILSTGGGVPGPATNVNAEIYYPPCLFTTSPGGTATLAARPLVASVSGRSFGYGAQMTVSLASTDQIRSVSVVGLSSTTHSFNTGQRFIPAAFRQTGQTVSVALPASAAIAPPGYYMVFVVNQAGTPSQGTIVALGGADAPAVAPTGIGQQWANIGINSKRVVHGADGTTMVVSTDGTLWLYAGDNNWINLPAPAAMTDAAIVKRNSIYAQDGNGGVYRYNGTSWTQVGAKALGASADGTVIITSADQTIWAKAADDNAASWTQVAGRALRVVPANAKSFWAIGTDTNVYHLASTGGWTQVCVAVSDLAVSNDGFVLATNAPNKTLWLKTGDDNVANWTNVANQTAVGVAVAPGGKVVVVGTDGDVYRR